MVINITAGLYNKLYLKNCDQKKIILTKNNMKFYFSPFFTLGSFSKELNSIQTPNHMEILRLFIDFQKFLSLQILPGLYTKIITADQSDQYQWQDMK